MYVSGNGLHVLDRSCRQNAVPEVEDVARPSSRSFEHLVRLCEDAIERPEEHRRIEVALHRAIEPDAFPRLAEWRAPVGANHIAAGFPDFRKNGGSADAKMNGRHAERSDALEDTPGVRQDELAIILRVQHADPRVEYLYRIDAGLDLRGEILAGDIRQQIAETVPRGRVAVHQRFCVGEGIRVAAF